MRDSKGKSRVITLRLKEDEYARFEQILCDTGISKSDFFRLLILGNFDPNKHNKIAQNNHRKLLFYFNKASNNINQIAKRLNQDHRNGIVSETTYKRILNVLVNVRDTFSNGVDKC